MDYMLIVMGTAVLIGGILGVAVMEYLKREQTRYREGLRSALDNGSGELASYLRQRFSRGNDENADVSDEDIISEAYFRLWKAHRHTKNLMNPASDVERRLRKEVVVGLSIFFVIGLIFFIIFGIAEKKTDILIMIGLLLAGGLLLLKILSIAKELDRINEDCLRILGDIAGEGSLVG